MVWVVMCRGDKDVLDLFRKWLCVGVKDVLGLF